MDVINAIDSIKRSSRPIAVITESCGYLLCINLSDSNARPEGRCRGKVAWAGSLCSSRCYI